MSGVPAGVALVQSEISLGAAQNLPETAAWTFSHTGGGPCSPYPLDKGWGRALCLPISLLGDLAPD